MTGDELLTLRQAAVYLRISDKTLVRLVDAGRLPTLNVSSGGQRRRLRFRRADLDKWLAERVA